jgi:ribosomal protein S3
MRLAFGSSAQGINFSISPHLQANQMQKDSETIRQVEEWERSMSTSIVIENVEDFAKLLANAIADALERKVLVMRSATPNEVRRVQQMTPDLDQK